MSGNARSLLAVEFFWVAVVGLAAAALAAVRRSGMGRGAKGLSAAWVVGAPVVGPLSYFLVRPRGNSGRDVTLAG